jgi:prepilin-type N-terminal cleavage/methylation domain-containing protein
MLCTVSHRKMNRQSRLNASIGLHGGFGLIEILVVLVIIGILMAVMVPTYLGSGGKDAAGHRVLAPKQRAQAVGTAAYVEQINQAIQMYRMDNDNRNPPSLEALKHYGLTDEMIVDQVTHQPIPYDPNTGQVVGSNGPDSLGGGANGRLPVFEASPASQSPISSSSNGDGDN